MSTLNPGREHESEVRWCKIDEDSQMKDNLELFDHRRPLGSRSRSRAPPSPAQTSLRPLRLVKPTLLLISLYALERALKAEEQRNIK